MPLVYSILVVWVIFMDIEKPSSKLIIPFQISTQKQNKLSNQYKIESDRTINSY